MAAVNVVADIGVLAIPGVGAAIDGGMSKPAECPKMRRF